MRDVAHSVAPPDQAPYAVAEAVFAEAKAYLSSREAQQMSESELERELHRRGQELMAGSCKDTSINAPRGRPPVRSRGPTMSSARSGVCRNATRRRPSGRCRLRAPVGRARRCRRDAARPRERRRRPYGVVIDLIHVAEYVCCRARGTDGNLTRVDRKMLWSPAASSSQTACACAHRRQGASLRSAPAQRG